VGELKAVMAEASAAVVGRAMAVSASVVGLDEIEAHYRPDFVSWIQLPRCHGYLGRLKGWEERRRRKVVPYG
jgi:hypothetical protein